MILLIRAVSHRGGFLFADSENPFYLCGSKIVAYAGTVNCRYSSKRQSEKSILPSFAPVAFGGIFCFKPVYLGMKKALFALFVFAQYIANAQFGSTSGFVFDSATDVIVIAPVNCEPYEHFTDWAVTGMDVSFGCNHEWVYAQREDVNDSSGITNAVYCPCGCPQTEVEARICRNCYREETRVRSWGYTQKTREDSEYMKLKKKSKQ